MLRTMGLNVTVVKCITTMKYFILSSTSLFDERRRQGSFHMSSSMPSSEYWLWRDNRSIMGLAHDRTIGAVVSMLAMLGARLISRAGTEVRQVGLLMQTAGLHV